jgi:hypothetical protein
MYVFLFSADYFLIFISLRLQIWQYINIVFNKAAQNMFFLILVCNYIGNLFWHAF